MMAEQHEFMTQGRQPGWHPSKVMGVTFLAFTLGLGLGGIDRILNVWNQWGLAHAMTDFRPIGVSGRVWDGDRDATTYCDRMIRSGHEDDAMQVLLDFRRQRDPQVRQQALLVLSLKLGESSRAVIAQLTSDLNDPTISEESKQDVRVTLAVIRELFSRSFPDEIARTKIPPYLDQ